MNGASGTDAAVGEAAPAIAMVTYNSEDPLRRFLDDQLATAEALGTELIVVDNASEDGSLALLEAAAGRSPALRVVRMEHNAGYAAGVNAAFRAASGRDVMLINPDVALHDPEPVRELRRLLGQLPRAALIAPGLESADGTQQPSARRYPSLASMVATLGGGDTASTRAYRHYIEPSMEERRSTVVDWVIGAAMLIRRRAWEAVDGWDERFFLYMEDADFCRRCARADWDVVFAPKVRLRHDYARMSSKEGSSVFSDRARRRHMVSLARFFAREPGSLLGLGRYRETADPRRHEWPAPATPMRRRLDPVPRLTIR